MRTLDESDGFSLVELLVVVIVLGIIAAIAIPQFLGQRQDAFDAAAVSDLRNLMAVEIGLLTSQDSFSEDPGVLAAEDWAASQGVVACADTSNGGMALALAAWHTNGGTVYSWSSTTSLTSAATISVPANCAEAIAPGATEVS